MGFKSRSQNNGLLDPNISTKGRPREDRKLTRRELLEKEEMAVLRKIRPHISQAVLVAAKIMNDPKAAEAPRLKACTIILDNYKELYRAVYNGDGDEDGEEIQTNQPKTVFSLHMLPDPKEEKKD